MKHIYTTFFALAIAGSVSAQTQRLTLVEGFTSNTCGPCAGWNNSYSPILEANNPNEGNTAGVAVLKYQMDWPSPGNDPSNNNDADSRRSFYGVTGIPDWKIDGEPNGGTQAEIDAANMVDSYLEIDAAYTLTGTTIDVELEFTPLADLGNGHYYFIALANKSYTYTGGTNGETSFKHVFRKMLPNAAGGWLASLDSGVTVTKSESYTFTVGTPTQNDNNFWNADFEVVVFVQKKTGGSSDVLNAAVATEGALGIADGDSDDFGILLYPNPANEQTNLVFEGNGSDDVIVTVYDNVGKLVSSQNYGSLSGKQTINMTTSDMEAGMYHVNIQIGNRKANSTLVVNK